MPFTFNSWSTTCESGSRLIYLVLEGIINLCVYLKKAVWALLSLGFEITSLTFVFLTVKFMQGVWVVFWQGRISCINIWMPSQASASCVFGIKNWQLIGRVYMKSKLVMTGVRWKLCSCVFLKMMFWSSFYGTVPLWSEKHFTLKKNETSRDVL